MTLRLEREREEGGESEKERVTSFSSNLLYLSRHAEIRKIAFSLIPTARRNKTTIDARSGERVNVEVVKKQHRGKLTGPKGTL